MDERNRRDRHQYNIILENLRISRGCSIKCVKVRKVIINNFDHGKERIEEKREAITIE